MIKKERVACLEERDATQHNVFEGRGKGKEEFVWHEVILITSFDISGCS